MRLPIAGQSVFIQSWLLIVNQLRNPFQQSHWWRRTEVVVLRPLPLPFSEPHEPFFTSVAATVAQKLTFWLHGVANFASIAKTRPKSWHVPSKPEKSFSWIFCKCQMCRGIRFRAFPNVSGWLHPVRSGTARAVEFRKICFEWTVVQTRPSKKSHPFF